MPAPENDLRAAPHEVAEALRFKSERDAIVFLAEHVIALYAKITEVQRVNAGMMQVLASLLLRVVNTGDFDPSALAKEAFAERSLDHAVRLLRELVGVVSEAAKDGPIDAQALASVLAALPVREPMLRLVRDEDES